MKDQLKKLKELALAANQSEWLYHEHGVGEHCVYSREVSGVGWDSDVEEPIVVHADDGDGRYALHDKYQGEANCRYIAAASPANMLKLIALIEELVGSDLVKWRGKIWKIVGGDRKAGLLQLVCGGECMLVEEGNVEPIC